MSQVLLSLTATAMDAVQKSFQNAIKTFSRFTGEDLEKFRFPTIDDVRSVLAAFQEDG